MTEHEEKLLENLRWVQVRHDVCTYNTWVII